MSWQDPISDIVHFVIECLQEEKYVLLGLDELFLSNKDSYQRTSFPHANLIHGYDLETRSFDTTGFNKGMIYGDARIGFHELTTAYYENKDRFWITYQLQDADYSYDLPVFKTYLNDFLAGTNTFEGHRPPDATFGMNVVNQLAGRFSDFPDYRNDVRSLHILWEHKKCMLERLDYLHDQGFLESASAYMDLKHNYQSLLLQAESTRNIALKYRITKQDHLIKLLCEQLQSLAANEYEAASRLQASVI